LISAIKYLKKEREENKSSNKELMNQKESVQGSEKDQHVIKNLRAQLEEARRIEETLEYQKKCLEANIEAEKEEAEKSSTLIHPPPPSKCGRCVQQLVSEEAFTISLNKLGGDP
jgi:small-conductance mechanosensitive channel